MAIKKEIEVLIAPDGSVTLTTHGMKGSECEEETRSLERNLGRVTGRKRTSEYYEQKTGTSIHITKK